MNPLAHPPKMLPWLAHEAGISERRAEVLWRSALKHAAHVGDPGSPEFWRAAMDELLQLLAAESRREDEASFGWRPWARAMQRFVAARIEAIDEIALAPIRSLHILARGLHARQH